MILCVTPNPALDRTLVVPQFQVGAVLRPSDVIVVAGGKGLNVARAVRVLGGDARCAGLIGGHSGHLFAGLARREGLEGIWTWVAGETRICTIIVDPDSADTTGIYEPSFVVQLDGWERFHADVIHATNGADAVCLCGSLPRGVSPDAFAALVMAIRATGALVWVDTSGAALAAALRTSTSGIKINGDEAAELLGHPVADIAMAHAAAAAIRGHGVDTAVVTLGRLGAVLLDRQGCWWAKPPEIQAVNTVGSGDACLAGLLQAYTSNISPPEALRQAVAAGAANAQSVDAGTFSRKTWKTLLEATTVKSLSD